MSLCIFLPGTAVGWFFRFPSCLVFSGVFPRLLLTFVGLCCISV